MIVKIHNHYTNVTKTIEGPPGHVVFELLRVYPWLQEEKDKDPAALVERLNWCQTYSAKLEDAPTPMAKSEGGNLQTENETVRAMLGHNEAKINAFEAAKWLAGGAQRTLEQARQALYEADGDPEQAALLAYGMEVNERNLKALRSVRGMSAPLAAPKRSDEPVNAQKVQPGHPDADNTAEEVQRAFDDRFVFPVELGGKHSRGSLLARDRDTGEVWLLKPGSGGQTPAAGAAEDPSSQSRREAAFFHMADAWGLGQYLPHTDLIIIDGKEYAAIKLLPWSYKTLDKIKAESPADVEAILRPYLNSGMLHEWAVLDFVLGNPDRHAANLMVRGGDVKLIDHGSAMAGEAFDPAHEKNSFTPYYLRAWATTRFSIMDAASKLKVMPRLSPEAETKLRSWIDGLKAEDLDKVLLRYGCDPAAAKERLGRLKIMMSQSPADLAINRLWAET